MNSTLDLTAQLRRISQLQRQQQDAPTDLSLAHNLAVLCFWAAGATQDAESARTLRRDAIINFAMALESDDYWGTWVASRSRVYRDTVPGEARSAAREAVIERIQRELAAQDQRDSGLIAHSAGTDALPSANDKTDSTAASLELAFQLETKATRLVKLAGGLAVEGARARVVCGPLMARQLGLTPQVSELARRLPESDDGMDMLLDMLRQFMAQSSSRAPSLMDGRSRRQLMTYFSQLGPAAVLVDRGEPQRALAMLRRAPCPICGSQRLPQTAASHSAMVPFVCRADCPRFVDLNPAYVLMLDRGSLLLRHAVELTAEAYLALAEQRIRTDPPDTAGAVRQWQEAIGVSAAIGAEGRFRDALADMVVGRATSLEQQRRLDDAIALLLAAQELGGHERLSGKLAELLTDRGVKAGNEQRWAAAVTDLRRALDVNPHVLRTRNNFVTALRGAAAAHFHAREMVQARPLLEEAVRVLETGLAMDQANEQWRRDLLEVRMELSAVDTSGSAGHGPLDDALMVLEQLLGSAVRARSDSAKAEAMRLLSEATEKASEKNYEEALALTERGLELDPDSPLLLRALSSMVNNRAVQLAEQARFDEAVALLERGLQRFPGDAALERNMRSIAQARELDRAASTGSPLDRLSALLAMLGTAMEEADVDEPAKPIAPVDLARPRAAELAARGRDKARRQDYAAAAADLEEAHKLAPQDAQLRRDLADTMEKHADALIAAGKRDDGLAVARQGLTYVPDHAGLKATIAAAQFAERTEREGAGPALAGLMAELARAVAAAEGADPSPYKHAPADPKALQTIRAQLPQTGLKYQESDDSRYTLAFRTEHRGRIVAQLQVVGDMAIISAPVPMGALQEVDVLYSLLRATHEADIFKVCRAGDGKLFLGAEVPAGLVDAKRLEGLIRGAIENLDTPDAELREADKMLVHIKAVKAAHAMQENLAGGRRLLDLLRGSRQSDEAARLVPEFCRKMGTPCEALDKAHFRLTLGWADWTIMVFCRGKSASFIGTMGDITPARGNLRFYRRMAELNAEMDVCKTALDSREHLTFLYELPALDETNFRHMRERLEDYIVRYGMELMRLV